MATNAVENFRESNLDTLLKFKTNISSSFSTVSTIFNSSTNFRSVYRVVSTVVVTIFLECNCKTKNVRIMASHGRARLVIGRRGAKCANGLRNYCFAYTLLESKSKGQIDLFVSRSVNYLIRLVDYS